MQLAGSELSPWQLYMYSRVQFHLTIDIQSLKTFYLTLEEIFFNK